LRVGVCGDELDTGHTFVDHVLDRVATCATNADDLDHGSECCVIDHIKLHDELPNIKVPFPSAKSHKPLSGLEIENRLRFKNIFYLIQETAGTACVLF
jgi:hypothetical protein